MSSTIIRPFGSPAICVHFTTEFSFSPKHDATVRKRGACRDIRLVSVRTVDEARAIVLQGLRPLPAEAVPLEEAGGRVLAESVRATRTVPPFRNSAMDGYAVRARDVDAARPQQPVRLQLIGEVAAGRAPAMAVREGTAVRVMTGAPLPDGSDAVVRLEDTRLHDGAVEITVPVTAGTFVRHPGEDIRSGDNALPAGVALTPARIGLLASLGLRHVLCHRAPRAAVLTTGDELRDIDEELAAGQITNSNRYALLAAVREAGGVPVDLGVARDRVEELTERIAAAAGADLLVISGGVSMGAYDLVRDVVAARGQLGFWQVALRPGHQLAFGQVSGTPLLGLPGNPVSTLVAFELFGRPLIRLLAGRPWRRASVQARAEERLEKSEAVEQYYRGILRRVPSGWSVRLSGPQGSHVLRSLALANCLIRLPVEVRRVDAGEAVDVLVLADDALASSEAASP
jgi:molybdopterin molybdotransferase